MASKVPARLYPKAGDTSYSSTTWTRSHEQEMRSTIVGLKSMRGVGSGNFLSQRQVGAPFKNCQQLNAYVFFLFSQVRGFKLRVSESQVKRYIQKLCSVPNQAHK